jgi:hypothetical protein
MFIDFIDIILFSGPFLVFGGMGQSKDSGKLTFKGLTSSDSTVNILEDATSITFSSNSSGSPIDQYEIVYGTGTGITSSIFCVDIRSGYESITGVGVISPKLNNNVNSINSAFNNIIVGGESNLMSISKNFKGASSMNNILVGGCENYDLGATTSNFGNYNSIVGGSCNCISNSNSSVIIGGCDNYLGYLSRKIGNTFYTGAICNSSIISSDNSTIVGIICNSSIISSYSANLGLGTKCVISGNTIISSHNKGSGLESVKSSIYSLMASSYNSCLGGKSNILLSVSKTLIDEGTLYSSIFSASGSNICNSSYSSIISGSKNLIYGTTVASKFLNRVYDSNIFAGCNNYLRAGFQEGTQSLCSAAIFSGSKNCIITQNKAQDKSSSFKGSVILGGYNNQIISATATSDNLVIGGGRNNKINYSFSNSIITNGEFNYISGGGSAILAASSSSIKTSWQKTTSTRHVIISSYNSSIYRTQFVEQVQNSAIISNECSNIKRGNNNILLSGKCNNIWIWTSVKEPEGNDLRSNNSIIGGYKNQLVAGNSSILGGYKNRICVSESRGFSSIIGGSCNYIEGSAAIGSAYDSSIVGGCKNKILDKARSSVIIGGYNNKIFFSESGGNSVIVGGYGLTNSWNNSAMIGNVFVNNNFFWSGITGFSGKMGASDPVIVRGGIITIF